MTPEQMQAHIEHLEGALAQQAQQLAAQTAQIQQLTAQASNAAPNLTQQALQVLINNQQEGFLKLIRESTPSPSLVDSKGRGKPAVFKSELEKWSEWGFKMKNFIASVNPGLRRALTWAEARSGEITQLSVEAKFGEISEDTMPNVANVNSQIYTVLTGFCEGESFDILKNVSEDIMALRHGAAWSNVTIRIRVRESAL